MAVHLAVREQSEFFEMVGGHQVGLVKDQQDTSLLPPAVNAVVSQTVLAGAKEMTATGDLQTLVDLHQGIYGAIDHGRSLDAIECVDAALKWLDPHAVGQHAP